jgi:hypothetical protein
MTNNLAYFASSSATNKKRFKTLTTVGKLCGRRGHSGPPASQGQEDGRQHGRAAQQERDQVTILLKKHFIFFVTDGVPKIS